MVIRMNVKASPLHHDENVCIIDETDLCINYRHLAWRIISLERNLGNYAISIHACILICVGAKIC